MSTDNGDFDSETARKVAEETAWENRRKKILKRHGLWEKYGESDEDGTEQDNE